MDNEALELYLIDIFDGDDVDFSTHTKESNPPAYEINDVRLAVSPIAIIPDGDYVHVSINDTDSSHSIDSSAHTANKSISITDPLVVKSINVIPTAEIEWKHPWNTPTDQNVPHIVHKPRSLDCLSVSGLKDDGIIKLEHPSPTNNWYHPIPGLLQLGEAEMKIKENLNRPASIGYNRHSGVSSIDIEITRNLGDIQICRSKVFVPQPFTSFLDVSVGINTYRFVRDDFQVSFIPILKDLTYQLQQESASIETNRCFFLHLGIAMGLHPFSLQVVFRNLATNLLKDLPTDDLRYDLLSSVCAHAGFVDANCLCYLSGL
jgi:hypothetical protein